MSKSLICLILFVVCFISPWLYTFPIFPISSFPFFPFIVLAWHPPNENILLVWIMVYTKKCKCTYLMRQQGFVGHISWLYLRWNKVVDLVLAIKSVIWQAGHWSAHTTQNDYITTKIFPASLNILKQGHLGLDNVCRFFIELKYWPIIWSLYQMDLFVGLFYRFTPVGLVGWLGGLLVG